MCPKFAPLVLVCLSGLAAQNVQEKDHQAAETGFVGFAQPAASHAAGSKYFQDMYMAQHNPKEIEFGHVCENPNEWEQRFEKINLENLNRQGKVRWGDKHGGYGEHYWDYNHAGHDGEGGESQHSENYEEYPEESRNSPASVFRNKRNPDEDVEFINNEAKSLILEDQTPKHGGNYRRAKNQRSKRQPMDLVFDQETGLIVDQSTGIQYKLQPINNQQ